MSDNYDTPMDVDNIRHRLAAPKVPKGKWYPREPVTLNVDPSMAPWSNEVTYHLTGAEFAAAFRPAEHLDQLLAAAREVVERFNPERLLIRQREGRWSVNEVRCLEHLREALRQWEAS